MRDRIEEAISQVVEASTKTYKTVNTASSRERVEISSVGKVAALSALDAAKTVLINNRNRLLNLAKRHDWDGEEVENHLQFYSAYGRLPSRPDAGWAENGEENIVFVVGPGSNWFTRVDKYRTWDKQTRDEWVKFIQSTQEFVELEGGKGAEDAEDAELGVVAKPNVSTKQGLLKYLRDQGAEVTENPDGTVDVDGNVDLVDKRLTKLPVQFNKVTGDFDCSLNLLTSLYGTPKSVGGNFMCHDNQLTSLQGAPKSVGGKFRCAYNPDLDYAEVQAYLKKLGKAS